MTQKSELVTSSKTSLCLPNPNVLYDYCPTHSRQEHSLERTNLGTLWEEHASWGGSVCSSLKGWHLADRLFVQQLACEVRPANAAKDEATSLESDVLFICTGNSVFGVFFCLGLKAGSAKDGKHK